jgi:hypothetical protein
VLTSYTIDFVMPAVYRPPLNDSPDHRGSELASAHFDIMTSTMGNESCSVCHDSGRDLSATFVHKIR